MNKTTFLTISLLFITAIISLSMSACSFSNSPNDVKHWFSSYEKTVVKYDDSSNNINDAGTYWKMTANKDFNVSIGIINDSLTTTSVTEFSINGIKIKSERNTDIYTFYYTNLKIKKGDKLSFHAYGIYSSNANTVFTMSMFVIESSDGHFPINDIN